MGIEKDKEKEQSENLKFKKAIWRKNNKEIGTEMDGLPEVKDLKMPTTKIHIKGNTSSMYRDNMQCHLCKKKRRQDSTLEKNHKGTNRII